jgi:hypothetical protein
VRALGLTLKLLLAFLRSFIVHNAEDRFGKELLDDLLLQALLYTVSSYVLLGRLCLPYCHIVQVLYATAGCC